MSGQRKALIVASDEYEHEVLGGPLAPAADDAAALGRVLADPQIGGFAVQVVHNEPAHIIQAEIEDFLIDSRPEDVLLLHFSCLGLKSESGELFFAARNTRPNRLASTAVAANWVQRCLRTSRSRSIVLLLDCRYGGAFSQHPTVRVAGDVSVLDSSPNAQLSGGPGRAVITASSAMEYAFEGDQLAADHAPRPSVFTQAVVDGLATGDADRDEDGWVSLDELYDYVVDKVREQNPHQTPSREIEMQGELYVARSPRRRMPAGSVTSNVGAARTNQNMDIPRRAQEEPQSLPKSAPPPAARSQAKRRRSSGKPDDAVTRAVRAAVKPGLLTFNPPAEMIQGQWEQVEVGIARSLELREALAAGLRGRGEPQFEPISTSPFMSVVLSGPSFEVVSFGPSEQLVPEIARWEFDVRPCRAGQQTLTLCINLRVDSPVTTGGRIAVPVLKREIRIRVDVGFSVRRFLANNWQWLIATILGLGGVLAAWVTLLG